MTIAALGSTSLLLSAHVLVVAESVETEHVIRPDSTVPLPRTTKTTHSIHTRIHIFVDYMVHFN
jgi:hypothetical protein